MRILHVVPIYLPAVRYGGLIFAVHGLCRALAARGHELQVFTTNVDGPGISPTPIATPVDLDGIQIRYFPCPLVRRLYWAPALRQALHHEIGRLDIVHLHSVFLWPTWAAARAARTAGVPYVLSPRGMLVKDLIARRSRLAKSAWIHFIERSNIEQAAALHLTSELEGTVHLDNLILDVPLRPFLLGKRLVANCVVSIDVFGAINPQSGKLGLGG
jgi:glycosyltransferase involved in cell wall biosynthesis